MTEVSPAAPRFDPTKRRAVLLALSLVTVLASFEATIVSTAMPTIIGELEGLPLYSWVFAVYLLTTTVTMPLYGRLADLHGRRLILLVAIVLFLLGAAATETAGRLLAGRGPRSGVGLDPLLLRQALEHALLPVFAVLLGLALLNLFVAGFFPARADEKEPPVPSGPTRAAAGAG